ncbi:MAG: hypothetical protein LBN00_06620 [Oscillospiraceae bacterium]|jgi:hypothetical protein|nr:hypothetical protein [Oscillospiraceae bacterium]
MGIFGFSFKKDKPLPWDLTSDGELVTPALLKSSVYDDMDVEITLNLLTAYGIPSDKKWTKKTHGVDIFVPETRLEEARELLAAEIQTEDENE